MGWNSNGMNVLPIYMCVVYVYALLYVILLSSPYLLVIGDDRVRDTREQMMLMQVVLVRLSLGAGITLDLASERG